VGISDDLATNERPVTNGGFNVGDTDKDNLLDPGEVWKFEADYVLPNSDPDKTLTNVATASGDACGKKVTAWDDYTLVLFTLRKDVLLYWNHVQYPYPDPNTEFKVRVLDEAGDPLTGELTLTEGTQLYFWLVPGIYEFEETSLPPGYVQGYDTLRKMLPDDGLDWTLLNIIRYDLGITKQAPDGCISPGTEVTYTYTVTNQGPASVAPVVEDTILGTTYPVTEYDHTDDLDGDGLVDPGEEWTFTLKWTVPVDTQPGTITDTATVREPNEPTGWHKGGDLNTQDNTASDSIEVCLPTIQICGTKFSDDDGNGQQGAGEQGVEGVQVKLFTLGSLADRVEIGDLASEGTHTMQDWGPVEPTTHGGGWGSIAPGTLRTTWAPGNAPWASFTLNAGSATSSLLKIRALDGGSDDSFLVEVNGQPVYVYKADPSPTEAWYVHDIYVPGSGILTVKITAIGEAGPYFNPYGQLGVDWAELYPLTATSYQTTTGSNGGYCFSITDLNPFQNPATFYIGEIAPQGRTPSTDSVLGPISITQDPQSWQFSGKNFGNRVPSLLIVKKEVENHNVGTKTPSDFTFTVNGGTPQKFEADGQNEFPYFVGPFMVLEPAVAGYATTYDGCTGSVAPGETKTCTATNEFQLAHLKLVKAVENNGGGSALPTAWTLSASGPTPISGAGGVESDVSPGLYTLSESLVQGYTPGGWVCVGGSQNVNQITLGPGQSATCTITNDDVNLIQNGDIDKTAFVDTETKHTWTIDKVGDKTALTLLPPQTGTVNYDVTVAQTPQVTRTVRGQVTVHNPWLDALVVNSVTDAVAPGPVPA
jgi:hypothetical protein